MKHIALIAVLLLAALLGGCGSAPPKATTGNEGGMTDGRIFYRSLTGDASNVGATEWSVPAVSRAAPCECEPVRCEKVRPSIPSPDYFVDFRNESASLNLGLNKEMPVIERELPGDETHYFVLGHSHGPSVVGNAELAQKRARAVGRWLKQQGVSNERIHMLASWSKVKELNYPTRGVQVFKMNDKEFPLFIARLLGVRNA
jgi:hypothetical protein